MIPYEKHVLDNGLEVVLHQDPSDPVVAVYVYYHVGSSREAPGKSGFAHLFEHMLFQGSEHVGDNEHFKLIQEAGGTLNGTTNLDRTNYYETLPSNQLELALWLESDRMGFLLPAMTQEKLDNQRDVVMNERRQNYDNRPYGLVHEAVLENLFPGGHPYGWPTIGSMEDIKAATLEDVARFFRRWYAPSNATLAIGGDFDKQEALALVRKYFGSLPRGPEVERPRPIPHGLHAARRVVLEDRVKQPQLTLVWPTVEAWHPDQAAIELLGDVLSANKSSVLDRALMIDEPLASHVTLGQASMERAGWMSVNLRPNTGVSLDQLEWRVQELVAEVAQEGVSAERLAGLKTRREGALLRGLETVSARTSRLAHDNCFSGNPGRLADQLARFRAVTITDVQRVAREYLHQRPRLAVSCVPAGRLELAASGRSPDQRLHEDVLDRSRPTPGPDRPFHEPTVWHETLSNGLKVCGSPFDKVPVTRLSLSFAAGRLFEVPGQAGLASLTAELLEEGTLALSSTEMQDALDAMGAVLWTQAGNDSLVVRLAVLNEHLSAAVDLLEQMVLTPRFDGKDFERLQRNRLIEIDTRSDRPREIADDAYRALLFGEGTVRGSTPRGTSASVGSLSVDDVRAFWRERVHPSTARLAIVGSSSPEAVTRLFAGLAARWADGPVVPDAMPAVQDPPGEPDALRFHLVHQPGAAQSELRVGHPAVAANHPDYYPLNALNYILGGSFSSRINLNLREDKGYTYGARSAFSGGLTAGTFTVSTSVETASTAASVREILAELDGLHEGVRAEEVDFARKALSQALGRSLESAQARLGVLEAIAKYGYPDDYLSRRLAWLARLAENELDDLARRYVRPSALTVLVVGDRDKVLPELSELGEVVELAGASTLQEA